MLLSKLTPVILYTIKSTRSIDGDLVEEYENIFEADGAVEYLASDEVENSVYGANLLKTYRFKSIYNDLEPFLLEKTNNSPDKVTPSELVYDKIWDNATRPTGVHFWYKYAPFNGDKSDISVIVYSGEQIVGRGSLQETQTVSSYSQEGYTLNILYDPEYEQLNPNRILLTFRSGFNTGVESRESGGLVSSNTANPKFRGSELYIDDVELKYDR